MTAQVLDYDWSVTKEKVEEALRRIIATADPLKIIAFGSRARGDHREDADLDLAVILDAPEEKVNRLLPYTVLDGLSISVDMIPVSRAEYDDLRPWLNKVFNYAHREGVNPL
jgi:predicted nucleotidyltransferase